MLKKLKALSDYVDKISIIIASLSIALILLIAIYGAIFRYILNNPLPWPLPIERILMIWGALFGIAAALKRAQHMGVEGLIRQFPEKMELIIRYMVLLLILLFVIILFWYGWLELINNNDTYMITRKVRISSKWLVAAIPVSALIQLIHLLTAPYLIKEEMEKDLTEEYMEKEIK